MKISALAFIALFTITGLVSCKKDHDSPKVSSGIQGHWEGTYKSSASGNTFFYAFNIKAGGVIEEVNSSGEVLGTGTWQIDNNILSAHYAWPSGTDFSVLAAYYPQNNKLLGDWGYDNSATDGGTWEMSKTN